MTPREIIAMCRQKDVKAVDLRFTDLFGTLQHFTIPVSKLSEEVFDYGLGFDGSSLRGWQEIHESDMLCVPQADKAFVDPFTSLPTLAVTCNIQDPETGDDYSRDPRAIARKAALYLESTGVADKVCFGPRSRVLRFRQRPLRPERAIRMVLGRQPGGRMEPWTRWQRARHTESGSSPPT